MSERAIKKLKYKFILVSMLSLITTMLMIAGLLYLGNRMVNLQAVKSTLNYIVQNNGELIKWEERPKDRSHLSEGYVRILEEIFTTNSEYRSSEFQFATRYFAILFDKEGNVTEVKTGHIAEISESEAEEYGALAFASKHKFGRYGKYYYQKKINEDGTAIVVYLDSEDVLIANERLFYLALMLIGFGMIVAFCLVRFFSTKVIQSELKNAELQKQFMTNASHELKTPLAVIRANTEMTEILSGENEWTQSTMRQIDRMNGLIQNLVMITRADENHSRLETVDVDITKSVQETMETFHAVAVQNGKNLVGHLDEKVHMHADDAQIRQLCSLLVDNAIKYCDDQGEIEVSLVQKGKGVILSVANDYAEGERVDYSRFFERFYREDTSHNIDKGGYGIGLSIAESLVKQYRGQIDVSWKNGKIKFTCQMKGVLR